MTGEFKVPEDQVYKRDKVVYWYINKNNEVVWRYWAGQYLDFKNKKQGNYFVSENQAEAFRIK